MTKQVKGEIMPENNDSNYYSMLTNNELVERVIYPHPSENYRELAKVLAARLNRAERERKEEVRVEL